MILVYRQKLDKFYCIGDMSKSKANVNEQIQVNAANRANKASETS